MDDELRIYLVVRTDIALSREDLAAAAARATWGVLKAAAEEAPERFDAYDACEQPKIAVRVKSPGHLSRALNEAAARGLPARVVEAVLGVPAVVGIGPVTRADLPPFVAGLQLMGDAAPSEPCAAPDREEEGEAFWLVVREDARIPYGKLASQAGHGIWGTIRSTFLDDPGALVEWDMGGAPVRILSAPNLDLMRSAFHGALAAGLPTTFIRDAGRTVYQGIPTPTVVGVGPCLRSALPAEVSKLEQGAPGMASQASP